MINAMYSKEEREREEKGRAQKCCVSKWIVHIKVDELSLRTSGRVRQNIIDSYLLVRQGIIIFSVSNKTMYLSYNL